MFEPSGHQRQKKESTVNTQGEPLQESPMWPNRPISGQIQRESSALEIKDGMLIFKRGCIHWVRANAEMQRLPPDIQGHCNFLNTIIRIWKEKKRTIRLTHSYLLVSPVTKVSPRYILFSRYNLTTAGNTSGLSNITDSRLACLNFQYSTRVRSPKTFCKGDASIGKKDSSKDTTESLAYPAILSNAGSVAQGSSNDALTGPCEVPDPIKEGIHGTPGTEEPLDRLTFVPLDEGRQSKSQESQPEDAPLTFVEQSIGALTLEDTGFDGSLITGIDEGSDREPLAGRELVMPLRFSERRETAIPTVPTSNWTIGITTCAGQTGSSSTPTVRPNSKINSTSKTPYSNHGQKRMLDNQEGHSADEDEDPPEHPRSDVSETRNLKTPNKFACPFFKHDPEKYNPTDYHTCATKSWPNSSRLK
jgi:hypothetical protein